MRTFDAQLRAIRRYVPAPYDEPLTLLRASERDERAAPPEEGDFDWSPLCTGPFSTCVVPGTHATMVYAPHVRELASVVRAILDAAPSALEESDAVSASTPVASACALGAAA
ncbi:hypothetical protein WMF38_33140 [Sorangium sp. So ce118]